MTDNAAIREQIRLLVDPRFLTMREELFGSGVSFGRIIEGKLPTGSVVVGGGGGTTDPDDLGFIHGIAVYSGGTLVGTDKKELSFIGPSVTVAGDRATIDITPALAAKITNPMTTAGDIIYGASAGLPTRRAIGTDGQYLSIVTGLPQWVSIASGTGGALTDPTTTVGDLIYRNGGGVTRLGIGASGQVLSVSGGLPVWQSPAFINPMTTLGDIMRAAANGLPQRLPIGTEGYRLTVSGGEPQWAALPTDIGFTDPMTSSGDIIYRNGVTTTRLGIGSPGQVLTVSSGSYPIWATASGGGVSVSGFTNPMTTLGDIIYGETGGTATRLGVGSAGQVLTVAGGIPSWVTPSGGSGGGGSITISGAAYAQVIGDGSSTVYPVTHSLGTRDLLVQVRQNTAPYEYVYPNIYASGLNTTVITFNTAPTTSGYMVLIGVNGLSTSTGGGNTSVGILPLDNRTLHATYGDHFDDTGLNAKWTRYTVVSGDEAYQIDDGSTLRTKLFGGGTHKWYWQTAPAGDFEVQLKVAIFGTNQNLLGPAIINSAGDGVMTSLNSDGSFYIWSMTGYAYNSTNLGGVAEEGVSTVPWRGAYVWYALRKVGTTYSARWSINGITWSSYLTGSPTQSFTVDRIGFGRTFNTTTNWMQIDWFDVV